MKKVFLVSTITLIALFFRLYNLPNRYYFEWDQADDATKVMEIVGGKLRLIGPKVANEDTFFVGPQHYYLLAPFYLIGRGHPYSGAALSILIGTFTSLLPYLLFSSLFSPSVGFLVSLLLAITPDPTSWNAMYTTAYSLLVLFFSLRILNQTITRSQLYFLFFLLGFATTTHLANAVLIIPVGILLLVKRPKINYLLVSLFFLAPFLPLLVFDFRHQFLNLHKLLTFSRSTPPTSNPSSFVIFWKSLAIFPLPVPMVWQKLFLLTSLTLFLLFAGLSRAIFLIFWFVSPAAFLYFYHHQIPEYYFVSSLILLPIALAVSLKKIFYPYLAVAFLVILTYSQFLMINQSPDGKTLSNKLELVSCLKQRVKDKQFFLSYELPPGWGGGYDYLLKYRRLTKQIDPHFQLYTITTDPVNNSDKIVCRSGILYLVQK